jgi:hypothetical protein
LTAADVVTVLVDFLADCEFPFEFCLLRLFTSRNSSSWVVGSDEVLFAVTLCFACALTALSSFSVTVSMP